MGLAGARPLTGAVRAADLDVALSGR